MTQSNQQGINISNEQMQSVQKELSTLQQSAQSSGNEQIQKSVQNLQQTFQEASQSSGSSQS